MKKIVKNMWKMGCISEVITSAFVALVLTIMGLSGVVGSYKKEMESRALQDSIREQCEQDLIREQCELMPETISKLTFESESDSHYIEFEDGLELIKSRINKETYELCKNSYKNYRDKDSTSEGLNDKKEVSDEKNSK